MDNDDGAGNTATGFRALKGNVDGIYNVGYGYKTLHSTNQGSYNTVVGSAAGELNGLGNNNIFIGYAAGRRQPSDTENVFLLGSRAHSTSGEELSHSLLYGVMDPVRANQSLTVNGDLITPFSIDANSITIDSTPPGLAILLNPDDGQGMTNTAPQLGWSAASDGTGSGIAGYEVDFDGTLTDVGSVLSWTPPPQADGSYSWRVRAIDNAFNTGTFTAPRTLVVDTTGPLPVSLVSPSSNSTVSTSDVTFNWAAASDAYDRQYTTTRKREYRAVRFRLIAVILLMRLAR